MKPPPYDLVYQDDRWAIVDMADNIKAAHRAAGVYQTYPWIMHWCELRFSEEIPQYWDYVHSVKGCCIMCKEIPPDHIITIHALFK